MTTNPNPPTPTTTPDLAATGNAAITMPPLQARRPATRDPLRAPPGLRRFAKANSTAPVNRVLHPGLNRSW